MKIDHIGYLVKKMDRAIKTFENLGYRIKQDKVRDEFRKIDICFVENDGYVIELVSPYDKDSTVSGLIRKYGNCPYHICYCSDDIDRDIEKMREAGYLAWDAPLEAPACGNRRVCFLIHPDLGMIELLENRI